jgi:hypothetical protein
MMRELEPLLAIQKQDLELSALEEKIAGLRKRRGSLEDAIAKEQALIGREQHRLDELKRRSRELSLEVDTLDEHIRADEKKLQEGLLSYKEMEAYRARVEHGRQRMDHLEDEALALMSQVESDEAVFQAKAAEFSKWKSKIDAEIGDIQIEIDQYRQKIAQGQAHRAELVQGADPALVRRYEALREEHPNPLVPMRHGSCTGCNVSLSQIIVERVREGREIVTCENCSRLLYA